MDIFHQIGNFFLQAAPTVVIFFCFYLYMRWAFFGPITRAMAERSAKIEGARAEAAAVEAAAKNDAAQYTDELNRAKALIYQEQEASRQVVMDERARLLKAMRARAQEELIAAKKKVEEEIAVESAKIDALTPALAGEIARSILAGNAPSSNQGNRN
jgi:F0F1-type ATP synthase membrane subunit b/b'